MDVCVRCNPAWGLLTDPEGKQYCPICGDKFIKETQPDPQPQPEPEGE